LSFSSSSYWIVDGIHFEQFGRTFKTLATPGNAYAAFTAYGIGIYGGDNIVVRNCTFRHTGIAVHDDTVHAPNYVLVENNTFSTNGLWDVFYREPFQGSYWWRIKNTPMEIFAVQAVHAGRGMVVRNNTFTGFATSVITNNGSANFVADMDIHNNISRHHLDDVYEVDSDPYGADGGNVNTAIFNNTSYGGLTFVSASAFRRGPLWVIGNYSEDNLAGPIKSGQQRASDPITNSTGWKLVYNNTFITDAPSTNGSSVYAGNTGHGNLVAKNNIFVGITQFIFNESSEIGAHRAPLLFENNVFYTTYVGQVIWAWEEHEHRSEDAADAASVLLEMTNNVYGINPFPSGAGGPLNSALAGWGVPVKGVTNSLITLRRPCGGADFNGNGMVDSGDLAYLAASLGQRTGFPIADLDSDNRVGLSDLAAFQRFQGQTCMPTATSASSPVADQAPIAELAPEALMAAPFTRPILAPPAVDAVFKRPLTVGAVQRGSRTISRADLETTSTVRKVL
jgi:hypothetical protein